MIPNIARLAQLAMDGDWKEGDHSRADNGQFGSGGGGALPGNGAHNNQPAQVSSTLTGVFTAAGFKKQKQPGVNGTVVYYHPQSGAVVTVHPAPAGKKWSSKWTHSIPGAEANHGEGSSLAKLLGVTVQKAAEKKAAMESIKSEFTPEKLAAIKAAPDVDLSALPVNEEHEAMTVLMGEGYEPADEKDDGDYTFFNKDDDDGGSQILAFNVKTNQGYFVDEYEAPTPAAATEPKLTPAQNAGASVVGKSLAKLGYVQIDAENGSYIYEKPGGAKVKHDAKTDTWVASTPGHMTKEGKGITALESLFAGKIAAGVKNSQQTIQTATEQAAMSESQKKAAEQHAKAVAAETKKNALYTKLKGQAPQPSASQQNAIAKYSGSGYSQWNDKLRHDPHYAKSDPLTKHLDDYLNSATFTEDVVVHRKVDGDYAKILKSIIFEGTKFIDRGYVSTSTGANKWHGSMTFKITCPKGSRGAAIGKWSHHPSEQEVLLPRNSAFVVTAHDPATNVIEVTLDQSHFEPKKAEQ